MKKILWMVLALLVIGTVNVWAADTATKIQLKVVEATPDDGNVAAGVLDGDTVTRFSSKGDGAYLILETPGFIKMESVKIAWYSGSSRKFYFDIFVSTDNKEYKKVYPAGDEFAVSGGNTDGLEIYTAAAEKVKFIKVVGHKNTKNLWFSPSEIEVWGMPQVATN